MSDRLESLFLLVALILRPHCLCGHAFAEHGTLTGLPSLGCTARVRVNWRKRGRCLCGGYQPHTDL